MVRSVMIMALITFSVVACADQRLTPAPGEHPGWPQPSPPRAADSIPLPFTTQYTVGGQVQQAPAARADGSIPFGVRGEGTMQAPPAAAMDGKSGQADPERKLP